MKSKTTVISPEELEQLVNVSYHIGNGTYITPSATGDPHKIEIIRIDES